MSERMPSLKIAERLVSLFLIIAGASILWLTLQTEGLQGIGYAFFIFVGGAITALGLLSLTARTK